jgi:hypothetical protein
LVVVVGVGFQINGHTQLPALLSRLLLESIWSLLLAVEAVA